MAIHFCTHGVLVVAQEAQLGVRPAVHAAASVLGLASQEGLHLQEVNVGHLCCAALGGGGSRGAAQHFCHVTRYQGAVTAGVVGLAARGELAPPFLGAHGQGALEVRGEELCPNAVL